MDLFEHIITKNPYGITSEDARQLFLWLYCTLDLLPEPIRHLQLSRKELVQTFTKLGVEGKITPVKGVLTEEILDPINLPGNAKYWEGLIDQLLHNVISLDWNFKARGSALL